MEIEGAEEGIACESEEELIKPYAIKRSENGQVSFVQWSDLLLKEEVLQGIKDNGFEFPSEIQFRAIPQIVADPSRDVLCQAKPGTGKTAVFILSILNMLNVQANGEYLPQSCMVIAHTRELAHQIFIAFRKLSSGFTKPQLRIACYFGGISYKDDKEELCNFKTTPHIIIGALGRLRHLVSDGLIRTQNVRHFVVDQCDSIVKQYDNFQNLKFLVKNTPPNKQTLMLTATLSQITRKSCLVLMRGVKAPFILEIANKKVNIRNLQHLSKRVEQKSKFAKLCNILDNFPFNQAIVFVNKIQKTEKLRDLLKMQLFNPICISSNMSQRDRLLNYDMFKSNGCRLMVATDLFGRGIDIQKVNLVINYDFPTNATTYMHRAGRAGRFGKEGTVISLVKPATAQDHEGSDQTVLQDVISFYQVRIEEIQRSIEATRLY